MGGSGRLYSDTIIKKSTSLDSIKYVLIKFLLFLILFAPVTLQKVKAVILIAITVLVIWEYIATKRFNIHPKVFAWVGMFVIVNSIFLVRGTYGRADIFKILAPTYIIWPIVYTIVLVISSRKFKTFDLTKLFVITTIAISSYILYFNLSFMGYLPSYAIVKWLPKYVINNDLGYIGFFVPNITSLFFLVPYIIANLVNYNYEVIVKKRYLWIAVVLSTIAALLTGRRALIAVICISPFISLLLSRYKVDTFKSFKSTIKKLIIGILLVLLMIMGYFAIGNLMKVELRINNTQTQVIKAGTEIRYSQFDALIHDWKEKPLLGHGFGVNAKLSVRSDIPGNYELSYVAMLFQTGVIGMIFYATLMIWLFSMCIKIIKSKNASAVYMIPTLTGLISVLIGNSTNPYIQSFDGLWIFFYPLALISRYLLNDAKNVVREDEVTIDNKDICNNDVTILMATYNGEKYIYDQIESIINQTFTNWKLLIRDDGSTDSTIKILEKFENQDSRIIIIRDEVGNLGQCLNFNELMKNVKLDSYVMFADQDDVWLPTKVEESMKEIKKIERIHGTEAPIVVYTNYNIVNSKLDYINTAYDKLDLNAYHPIANRLLIQNWLMGCTMIINNKLLKYSLEVPIEADNHDNWIALIASMTGHAHYLNKITMLHRLHSNNVTTNDETTNIKNRIKRVGKRFKENEKAFVKRQRLNYLIEQHLKNNIPGFENKSLDNYGGILKSRGIKSVIFAVKNKYYATNKVQTILFYIQLIIRKDD